MPNVNLRLTPTLTLPLTPTLTRYTTPFFLTEDGQACQPAAPDAAAAQESSSFECYVTLRALVAPARRKHPDRHGGAACLCLRHSPVSTHVFHVLSA